MTEQQNDFEDIAANTKESSIVGEFFAFMGENKKWWLTPFLIVFGLLGIIIVLAGTGVAPFIYAMF